jgi:PAT family beta-lactamase induction signal transducer AmpG
MELIHSRLLSNGTKWHLSCLSVLYLSQGLSAGFLLALTTYLASKGASLVDISLLLSITMLPWTLKIFFGPILDSLTIKRFGRRRFWIISSQIIMILVLLPLIFIEVTAVSTLLIAIFTVHNLFVAVSDIATDALAADSLKESDLAKANGYMWGSKIIGRGSGMLISSTLLFSYGFNVSILFLISCMTLVFIFPFTSSELGHKEGAKDHQEYKNVLGLKFLFSEISQGLLNKTAIAAAAFMLFSNIAIGIFDVTYNKFYLEVLGMTGEDIGTIRPVGMWLGGLIGFSVGLISFYLGKRMLLVAFLVSQILLFIFLSTFNTETSQQLGSLVIIGLDITEAAVKVIIFAILMALCTTQTSATNFGIFMGFANLSTILGNSIAPLIMEYFTYSVTYIFAGLSLVPCVVLAFYLTAAKN